jgi:hypothetical protein
MGCVLVGCVRLLDIQQSREMKPMRYLALGDSYTIGESVTSTERWPVQLAAQLHAHGLALADPLSSPALAGRPTNYWLASSASPHQGRSTWCHS